jgi:hypothetical protein
MHVFISYAKKDTRPLAERLFRELNAIDGMSAWMDESLEPASSWARQIEREIDRADYMIVLISPDVSRPETPTQPHSFVLNEIQRALESRPRKPILPVLAQRAPIPVELQTIQRIDATRSEDEAVAEIIEHLYNKAGIESPTVLAKRLREEAAARQRREDEERRRQEQAAARQQAEAAARGHAAEQERQAESAHATTHPDPRTNLRRLICLAQTPYSPAQAVGAGGVAGGWCCDSVGCSPYSSLAAIHTAHADRRLRRANRRRYRTHACASGLLHDGQRHGF